MTDVRMPQMGVSVTEGTVTAWHKSVGDPVAEGEAVCDVATDKADTEVVADAAGFLAEIVAQVGDVVEVGEVLARLGGAAGTAATDTAVVTPAAGTEPGSGSGNGFDHRAAAEEVAGSAGASGRPAASPLARRLAAERGIDLTTVAGSGLRGRIRKSDVLAAAAPQPSDAGAATTAAPQRCPAAAVTAPPAHGIPPGYEDVPHEIVETTRMRRVIAAHMIRSRQTAAHMTTEADVDCQRLTDVRASVNAQRLAAGRSKLSYLPFITRAACAVLRDFPDLNATFQEERHIRWREVNMGVAVDTAHGLMAPVIRGCDTLTVDAIAERIAELAQLARSRQLTPDDLRAGTFTISNPGSAGGVSAMAIINQPQVGILGVPVPQRRPWVVAMPGGGEAIAIRPILRLALTFDHRAVDGADATRCVVAIKDRLEAWDAQDYR